MNRIIKTASHEFHLELIDGGYRCVAVKVLELNPLEESMKGQKVKIENNRLVFEDGMLSEEIQEG